MNNNSAPRDPVDPAHIVEALVQLVQSDSELVALKPRIAAVSVDDDGIVTIVLESVLLAERTRLEALERRIAQIAGVSRVRVECTS